MFSGNSPFNPYGISEWKRSHPHFTDAETETQGETEAQLLIQGCTATKR